MEKLKQGFFYPIILSKVVKSELANYYSKFEITKILFNTRREYNAIIKRIPPMGGDENLMIKNMYLGAYLIALYRQIKDKVTLSEYKKFTMDGLRKSDFLRDKISRINYLEKRYQDNLARCAEWSENNKDKYPWTWQFTTESNPEIPEFRIYFTNCGLYNLCIAENISELNPILCETDFVMAEMAGCTFSRTKTLADGDDCCDFCYGK